MLYSQINYLGSFLPVPKGVNDNLQKLINSFVCGNLKIREKILYATPAEGGVGLFELETFLNAQKCAWIKRAVNLDELWKIRIYVKSLGNVLNVRSGDFDKSIEPVITCLVIAYSNFFYKYSSMTTYKNCFMFRNEKLTFDLEGRECLKRDDFNPAFFRHNKLKIITLRVNDFMTGDKVKTHANFVVDTGLNIDQLLFLRIRGLLRTAERKYGNRDYFCDKRYEDFFRFEKGSKKFRKVITKTFGELVPHNLVKFSENTETIINHRVGRELNKFWNYSFFSGEMGTFLFKLYHNRLGYNYVLANFLRGRSENCTFCELIENPENNRETPIHLFYQCDTAEGLFENFFEWLLTGTVHQLPSRQEFFVIFERTNNYFNTVMTVITKLFVFFLWQQKLRRILPSITGLKIFIFSELRTTIILNSEIREAVKHAGIPRLRGLGADLLDLALDLNLT